MVTEKNIDINLEDDFQDTEFRKNFFRSLAQTEVAEQIIKMRNVRAMRQVDLAQAADMKQSAISRIEQADYASWNFQTLLRIADALDARLRVSLEPIEAMVKTSELRSYETNDQEATGEHFSTITVCTRIPPVVTETREGSWDGYEWFKQLGHGITGQPSQIQIEIR
jgi:DNA-binding Xre family transcriptional regulator